jgi:hypothetical protein
MIKFKEVVSGYEADDNVDLLRVAESENGDYITLVKLKGEEQYQLSVNLMNGREAQDIYFDREFAYNMFEHILSI